MNSPDWDQQERRRHSRRVLETKIWAVTSDGTSVIMVSGNVSVGGAFLRPLGNSVALPPIGSRFSFCITSQTEVEELKNVEHAEVVRHASGGIGVRFLDE